MSKNNCFNCKFSVISGGDYAPGFGGCQIPEYVEDCNCSVFTNIEDIEEILDKGEAGNCEHFEEKPEEKPLIKYPKMEKLMDELGI